jgi:DNA-binding LacI/PurR family transcriptional regulator
MNPHPPLPRARHEHLLRQIQLHGSVSAAHAADELGVAQVTIRRDILALERQGLLVKVHGGAITAASSAEVPRSARTNIGVVIPSSVGHFPLIVKGMEAAAAGLHVRLILATSQYRPEVEERQVERLVNAGVDGVVLAPTLRGRDATALSEWVATIDVPVVFLERRLNSTLLGAYDSARSDHAAGAVIAVEHLATLGHSRVALALFDRTPTAPLIREGYDDAVRRFDLEPAPSVTLPKDDEPELDSALTAFLEVCEKTETRAALVHTDVHAARLIELAADRGMEVPDDFAVVAYDDDTAALALVPLTAVTAPRRDLGAEALRVVMDRVIEGQARRSSPRHLTILPHLTVRESCGAGAMNGTVRSGGARTSRT